jgi:hypothetical protein
VNVEAARQDYELAKEELRIILEAFDATDERGVGCYHAALERVEVARERLLVAGGM